MNSNDTSFETSLTMIIENTFTHDLENFLFFDAKKEKIASTFNFVNDKNCKILTSLTLRRFQASRVLRFDISRMMSQ